MVLWVFKWLLLKLKFFEVDCHLFSWMGKVICKDLLRFVDGNTPLKTGILVTGVSDFKLASQVPSIVENLLKFSGSEGSGSARPLA